MFPVGARCSALFLAMSAGRQLARDAPGEWVVRYADGSAAHCRCATGGRSLAATGNSLPQRTDDPVWLMEQPRPALPGAGVENPRPEEPIREVSSCSVELWRRPLALPGKTPLGASNLRGCRDGTGPTRPGACRGSRLARRHPATWTWPRKHGEASPTDHWARRDPVLPRKQVTEARRQRQYDGTHHPSPGGTDNDCQRTDGACAHARLRWRVVRAGDAVRRPPGQRHKPGTRQRPFATLERARDEVRRLDKAAGRRHVAVELAGGAYELSAPVEFTAADCGTAASARSSTGRARARRCALSAAGGHRLETGHRPGGPAAAGPGARGKVFQADLKALGITDLAGHQQAGELPVRPGPGTVLPGPADDAGALPEHGLHAHRRRARRQRRRRRPASAITTPRAGSSATTRGPARWASEKDIWLHGFWVWDWADLRIPLGSVDAAARHAQPGPRSPAAPSTSARASGSTPRTCCPNWTAPASGTWTATTGILYFWPPAPLSSGKVGRLRRPRPGPPERRLARHLPRPLIEAGRGSAVVVNGGSNVRVVGCTIRNMGNWAVQGLRRHEARRRRLRHLPDRARAASTSKAATARR